MHSAWIYTDGVSNPAGDESATNYITTSVKIYVIVFHFNNCLSNVIREYLIIIYKKLIIHCSFTSV